MAELADALDSGSSEHYAHAGSSPVSRTNGLHKVQSVFSCVQRQKRLLSGILRLVLRPKFHLVRELNNPLLAVAPTG